MPRRSNARSNANVANTPPFSPPTQLPTPLPEQQSVISNDDPHTLIDLETSPSTGSVSLPDEDTNIYRSPPFREAQLPPEDSPPPLPVLPRMRHESSEFDLGHTRAPKFSSSYGSPSTSPSPLPPVSNSASTTLEALTRTIRGYVPSSMAIPVPNAAPSPPLVSRPIVSRFTSPVQPQPHHALRQPLVRQEYERDYEHAGVHGGGDEYYGYGYGHSRSMSAGSYPTSPTSPAPSGLTQALSRGRPVHGRPQPVFESPPLPEADLITWSNWDSLHDRRVLLVGYTTGFQIWDYTSLNQISELLNIHFDSEELRDVLSDGVEAFDRRVRVIHGAILNDPSKLNGADSFKNDRPLLGILLHLSSSNAQTQSIFVLYSLLKHIPVKRMTFPGQASGFLSNEHVIVISTTLPASLHIISASSLQVLYTVSASSLELFSPLAPTLNVNSRPTSLSIANALSSITSPSIASPTSGTPDQSDQDPHPVFALSHRLLAYASPIPASSPLLDASTKQSRRLSSSSTASGASSSNLSSSPFGISKVTQADIGHAALKVGETVFSGMKFLGGIALDAARSRVGPAGRQGRFDGTDGGSSARPVSRSAPDTPIIPHSPQSRWDDSTPSSVNSNSSAHNHSLTAVHPIREVEPSGYYVTVVDLKPLFAVPGSGQPSTVDVFPVSRSQPVAALSFSADATSIAVVPRDGHLVKVFKLQPPPSIFTRSDAERSKDPTSVQVYTLRRGRTAAAIQSFSWAHDGRWAAIGTSNRTIHVFATNPYGGRPDLSSHLEGQIKNVDVVAHSLTDLPPLIRMRIPRKDTTEGSTAPLSFTFLPSLDLSSLANSPGGAVSRVSSTPSAVSPKANSTLSKPNHLYILVFNPEDGSLSLRLLKLGKKAASDGIVSSVQSLGLTSVSLPGMGGAGRLSSSPVAADRRSPRVQSKQLEPTPQELSAKETIVATWDLLRKPDWKEVRASLPASPPTVPKRINDRLSEAELSTSSKSLHVLPRSIYLSHQFSFYTLGEDYHALIRRSQLDVPGSKLEVRREVQVSSFGTEAHSSSIFMDGFTSPRDIRRPQSSSFDEPLASAISGSFDSVTIPSVLPMYPNGVPGSKPRSFRNSIPIRTIAGLGDGMNEGIGRLRREMHRVRPSAPAGAGDLRGERDTLASSVPLEFDEEDEDFLVQIEEPDLSPSHLAESRTGRVSSNSRETSRTVASGSSGSGSLPTPGGSIGMDGTGSHINLNLADDDVVGAVDEDLWTGWDRQDRTAIEEEEKFDTISTSGILRAELAPPAPASASPVSIPESKQKRKGRRK